MVSIRVLYLHSLLYHQVSCHNTTYYIVTHIRQVPSLHTTASGFIVTSQNRIFDHEAVITNITEIAGNQEIGEIQCRSYNGGNARWVRPGYIIPASSTEDVYKSENGPTATLFVKRTSNTSDDYYCDDNIYGVGHYINLYLSNSKS